MKPVIMWAIYLPKWDFIDPYSVRRTRREVIRDFINCRPFSEWKDWRKNGYRAVKVEVKVIDND